MDHMVRTEAKPKRDWLEVLLLVLVVAVVIVHPTSYAFSLAWLGKLLGFPAKIVEKAPRVTIADILIWLAGALLVLKMLIRRDFRPLKALAVPAVVLVLLAVASMLFARNKLTAIADVIQWVEYFIVLFLVLVNVLSTKEQLRLAALLWLAVGSAVALWGLVHYLDESRSVVNVSGSFLNRNILSGYLAILLPVAWGSMLHSRKVSTAVRSAVLVILGLVVMLAGGPWIAALIGVAVITFVRSPKLFPVLALALVILVVVVFPLLPRDNAAPLTESVRTFDETRAARPPNTVALDMVESRRLSARYLHWQAAMKFLTPSYDPPGWHRANTSISRVVHTRFLLLGCGIGNYQQNIGGYYPLSTKPAENTLEPDTLNLYLVMAVSVGIPAVLAFLWLVGAFLRRAAVGYMKVRDPFLRGLLLGCIGSLASLLITNVFTSTLVHGSGPAMILVFAFASAGACLAERESVAVE